MANHHNPVPQHRSTGARTLRGVRPALRATALLAAVVLSAALSSAPAFAGQWMQVSCANPDHSQAASGGWTSFTTGSPGYGSNNNTSCGPDSPMSAILSTAAPAPVGAGENLQYTPPAGSSLAGGSVDVSMDGDGSGYGASGTAIAYTPEFAYNASNVLLQCAVGQPACSGGTNDFSGVLTLPANRGGDFYIGAGCGGEAGASCDEGGSHDAWSLVQVWWADFLLSNDATPAATAVSGTLLDPNARGTQELTLNATDTDGPGVYNLTLQADGNTLYTGTPNTNGGKCAPVGETAGALMFDASQPCPQSESVDLPINTTKLTDGPHALKITVTDAAANSSVVYDSTITTHNAPENTTPPAITPAGQPAIGSTLDATPGGWTAPAETGTTTYTYQWEDCNTQGEACQPIPAATNASYTPAASDTGHTLRVLVHAADNDGTSTAASAATGIIPSPAVSTGPSGPPDGPETPTVISPAAPTSPTSVAPPAGPGAANGTPASETADLRLNTPATLTRRYARRAFTLTGELTNNAAQPIAGAILDILQQDTNATNPTIIGYAQTHATGAFHIQIPPGPSRTIEIAYKAYASDPGYAATANVQETVAAGVRLKITPSKRTPGLIILTGTVQGPIPKQGAIVELLVYYRGAWEPFRKPRTEAHGRFRAVYQFPGSVVGTFPFQAEVPNGQAGFPYITGYSKQIKFSTR